MSPYLFPWYIYLLSIPIFSTFLESKWLSVGCSAWSLSGREKLSKLLSEEHNCNVKHLHLYGSVSLWFSVSLCIIRPLNCVITHTHRHRHRHRHTRIQRHTHTHTHKGTVFCGSHNRGDVTVSMAAAVWLGWLPHRLKYGGCAFLWSISWNKTDIFIHLHYMLEEQQEREREEEENRIYLEDRDGWRVQHDTQTDTCYPQEDWWDGR